jgi:hypothetical protein
MKLLILLLLDHLVVVLILKVEVEEVLLSAVLNEQHPHVSLRVFLDTDELDSTLEEEREIQPHMILLVRAG